MSTTNNKQELLPDYNTQQRGIISCLKQTTNMKYYLFTPNNKDELLLVYKKHLPVYNTQQRRIIICLQQTTSNELLSVYNKQEKIIIACLLQRRIITCLQHATKKNYYLSTTRNKGE